MRRIMAMAFGIAILLACGVVIGARAYFGRPAEDRLHSWEDVVISNLRPPLAANAFVACPPGYCAIPDALRSPSFALSADRLADYFSEMTGGEPRVVTLRAQPYRRRLVLVQHSALFLFPDLVTAEFVPLSPTQSSVALYSRARYGSYDFGANRRRVDRWLTRLTQIVGEAAER